MQHRPWAQPLTTASGKPVARLGDLHSERGGLGSLFPPQMKPSEAVARGRKPPPARRKASLDNEEWKPVPGEGHQEGSDDSMLGRPVGRRQPATRRRSQAAKASVSRRGATGAAACAVLLYCITSAPAPRTHPNHPTLPCPSLPKLQAEPICIDLLSDEDNPASPPGAAAAAAGPPGRTTRAKAYRSTSEKFKARRGGRSGRRGGWEAGAWWVPAAPSPAPLRRAPCFDPACSPPCVPQGLKCLFPPGGGPGSVEVTALDLPRLDADEFLNDTVIDFYLK